MEDLRFTIRTDYYSNERMMMGIEQTRKSCRKVGRENVAVALMIRL